MNIDNESLNEALAHIIGHMMAFEREEYFAKFEPTLFQGLVDTEGQEKRHLKILVDPCSYNSLNGTGGYEVTKELKVSVSLAVATEEDIQTVQNLDY